MRKKNTLVKIFVSRRESNSVVLTLFSLSLTFLRKINRNMIMKKLFYIFDSY